MLLGIHHKLIRPYTPKHIGIVNVNGLRPLAVFLDRFVDDDLV